MKKEKQELPIEIKTQEQFPEDLFNKRDVVVLGEEFHGKHYKIILDFLDKFGRQLQQVFIELPTDYQKSVDTYFITGKVDNTLEDFFVGAEKEEKNIRGILKIFEKLKEIGKNVICIDSSKTKNGEYQKVSKRKGEHYFLRGESRDEDMFTNFQRRYEEKPGKYLLIVGGNHAEEGGSFEGDEKLGSRLKNTFGEKYISFELKVRQEET